ncbi:MAG: hypothetical protein ABIH56_06465, partial [Candidatus Margulisiibacteriota bacterium]
MKKSINLTIIMFAIVMLSCSSSLADLAPVKKISEVPKVSIKQTFLKVQVVDLKGQPYKGSSAYESDLENARVRLATMKNANGKRITVPRSEIGIVCPDA